MTIKASGRNSHLTLTGHVEMTAGVEAEAGKPARRATFSINAYNGGAIRAGFYRPIVIDLAGLRTKQRIPILLDHDSRQIVGQSESVKIENGRVDLAGVVTGDDEPAQKVTSHAKNGFEWAASVGVAIDKLESIAEGTTAKVNGQEFQGPIYVVRAGRLGEVSFVSIGADESASAKVAARSAPEDSAMTFEKWLEAGGWTEGDLSEDQLKTLKAAYLVETEGEKKATSNGDGGKVDASAETGNDPAKAMRESASVEAKRIAEITSLTGNHADLRAKAISEGWSVEKTQYEVKLADLPQAPAARINANDAPDRMILECAVRLGSSEPTAQVEKAYDDKTLTAAHKMRRMGLKALIESSLQAEGKHRPSLNASIDDWVRAGFSTATLPYILSNSANKILQSSFMAVPSAARVLAKKLIANDFKEHRGHRMTGDSQFDEVGPGGELKHMSLGETTYTFTPKTHGKMIGLTRQQWINDDLGAFTELPQKLGRGAALAIEDAFWTLVKANTGTFFGSGNGNYIEGATTFLGVEGLRLAVQTMAKLTDADGKPINVQPKFLVVPPELDGVAQELFRSTGLIATGLQATNARERGAATNIYANRYQPVMSPYLTAAKVYYLFADPMDIAAFGICYLNGVETPIVEEVPQAPNVLGFQWRGYIDFGVCQIDKQGAVMSKGEA